MHLFRASALSLMAGLSFQLGAGQAVAATPPAATPPATTSPADDDDPNATGLREYHRHHHRGGVAQFIALSLDTLGADDSKRPEVEQFHSDLNLCLEPSGVLQKQLLLTVADGVAAGVVATAKVDATLTQLDAAASAAQTCSNVALTKLHAVLSPMERAALVDKVQAHWEVWQLANLEESPAKRERGGRLADLADDLDLSADQVSRISAALNVARGGLAPKFDRRKVEAHIHEFVASFVGASFDAKQVAPSANAHLATNGGRRMALFYATVTPLLTPEQRATLAEQLREHVVPQPTLLAK